MNCKDCSKVLVKRPKEHISNFVKRKFCSIKCSVNYMRVNRLGLAGYMNGTFRDRFGYSRYE